MTENELQKLVLSMLEKQRKMTTGKRVHEKFAPCAFALEKYLKEYSSKERTLQAWRRTKPD